MSEETPQGPFKAIIYPQKYCRVAKIRSWYPAMTEEAFISPVFPKGWVGQTHQLPDIPTAAFPPTGMEGEDIPSSCEPKWHSFAEKSKINNIYQGKTHYVTQLLWCFDFIILRNRGRLCFHFLNAAKHTKQGMQYLIKIPHLDRNLVRVWKNNSISYVFWEKERRWW